MVFSSLIFIYAFLPLSLLCYMLCGSLKAKNISLLVFSLIFYAWGEPKYVLLLMLMAAVDWFCALRIDIAESAGERKMWLALAVFVDLLLIGVFKYAGLVCSIFGEIPEVVRRITLPIGISFYTFQLLTYVVDVYREDAQAEREYWHVLLYAALFHQCIAGPIVRYNSIAEELFVRRSGAEELTDGIRRFTCGLAKKALLANPCGALVDALLLTDQAASNPELFSENLTHLQGVTVLGSWLGMAAFMLQIYLDFSAYSDMAIGMGKVLGLHYPENFHYPYAAQSVTEFWRRWHMSLTGWITDYVFMPLNIAFRNIGNTGIILAAMINLTLIGLWHGANWTFGVFGFYHGLLFIPLIISGAFGKNKKLKENSHGLPFLKDFGRMCLTFCLWALSLVFFRADNISQAFGFMYSMLTNGLAGASIIDTYGKLYILFGLMLLAIEWIQRKQEHALQLQNFQFLSQRSIRYALYLFIILLIITFTGKSQAFIYFQF